MTNEIQRKNSHLHVRSIALDLVLTIFTCGLFNLYVQYKQIEAANDMLNSQKYSVKTVLLLTNMVN